jgi:hypothetical protein
MEKINFLCGGKTGDVIHNLFAIKSICDKSNTKANLYITNMKTYGGDFFHFDIDKTYHDLLPLINHQPYIDFFDILERVEVPEQLLNLNSWRQSNLIFKSCWTDLLCEHHNIQSPQTPWINYKKNDKFVSKVLVHRSTHRHTQNFPWSTILEKNECLFVTNKDSQHEYENFGYRNLVQPLFCETFSDMVEAINSCKFFVGNMSTPLAIAHSLGVPHLGELYHPDSIHYVGDEKYLKNYYYISNLGESFLENIGSHINI